MMRGLDMRRTHQINAARVDDDQLRALPQAAFHPAGKDRVRVGRVGADHEDHVRLHHRVEILRARAGPERGLEAIAGRRVAHPRAGIDIVRSEPGAHQLLHEEGFLIGAAAGGDTAKRPRPVLRLDRVELACRVGQSLVPRNLAPWLIDGLADHRGSDAIGVIGVTPCEAALDAGVAAIGLAVLPRHHAHQLLAAHLGAEGAADPAIGAGGDDRALGLPDGLDRLLLKRRGRTGLHAGAAAHAFAGQEIVRSLPGAHHARKAAPVDGQGQSALHLVAGTHAPRADDAFARVEIEIGVGGVGRFAEMVLSRIAITYVAQAHLGGLILKLAIVVGRTCQAIEGVIGDVEFHHPAPQLFEAGCLGGNHHALFGRRSARGRRAPAALDLDEAQSARAEGLDVIGCTQLRDRAATFRSRAHHRGSGRHGDLAPVDRERHTFRRKHFGRAEILLPFIGHDVSPLRPNPPVC